MQWYFTDDKDDHGFTTTNHMNIRAESFYIYNPVDEKLDLAHGFKNKEDAETRLTDIKNKLPELKNSKVVPGESLIKADGLTHYDEMGNLFPATKKS